MRVGIGYDVHRLVEGRDLIIGGVVVPYEKGLDGYSDADVLIHAIIDALLGASSLGDIGRHFPTGDSEYKDISSIDLLKRVSVVLQKSGFTTVNIDSTIICERPKMSHLFTEMESKIAEALGIEEGGVSVKATTTDGLGFTGCGEGVAAQAVALVTRA